MLVSQQRFQAIEVGRGQGPELVGAVLEAGGRALSEDQTAAGQFPVGLGDAAVLGMAEATDHGHGVEREFVRGQGEMGLGLRPVGAEEAGAIGTGTASDGKGQVEDTIEGGDGTEVRGAGPGPMLTFGAVEGDGDQFQGAIGLRARSSSFAHGGRPAVAAPVLRSRLSEVCQPRFSGDTPPGPASPAKRPGGNPGRLSTSEGSAPPAPDPRIPPLGRRNRGVNARKGIGPALSLSVNPR